MEFFILYFIVAIILYASTYIIYRFYLKEAFLNLTILEQIIIGLAYILWPITIIGLIVFFTRLWWIMRKEKDITIG